MSLELKKIRFKCEIPFGAYLLSDNLVKKLIKEFDFYNIRIYREENEKSLTICLDYPKGNVYWYLEFKKFIESEILKKDSFYLKDWNKLLSTLYEEVKEDYYNLKLQLDTIFPTKIISIQQKYNLRDYQALDVCQLLTKIKSSSNNSGLILSEQRTGKTRVAIATILELSMSSKNVLIVCPKNAIQGWIDELRDIVDLSYTQIETIRTMKQALVEWNTHTHIRIITYDLLKRLNSVQKRKILIDNDTKRDIFIVGDECHRLRNFDTLQSEAIFELKYICKRAKIKPYILGLTGTPSVKDSYDIFGSLGFINNSKISLAPTKKDFNLFKEYFYNCEDTSYGKICKSLKRKAELNFLIKSCAVQTKQAELDLFKNYTKKYKRVDLDMEPAQKVIYDEVLNYMEFKDDIDCKNSLEYYLRLRQICTDPFVLVSSFDLVAPKFKYIVQFAKKNKTQFLVFSKFAQILNHLKSILDKNCINSAIIGGMVSLNQRLEEIRQFKNNEIQVLLLQQDACKEALTLSEANVTIFLDRDFAQGNNEQAESRMTPVNGETCTKYVVDLVMKNTIEEDIYNILLVKKENISNVNVLYQNIRKKEVI